MVVLKSSVTSPMIPMSDVESSGGRSLMIVGQTSVTSMVVLKSSVTSPMIPMSDVESSGSRSLMIVGQTSITSMVVLKSSGTSPKIPMSDVEFLGGRPDESRTNVGNVDGRFEIIGDFPDDSNVGC